MSFLCWLFGWQTPAQAAEDLAMEEARKRYSDPCVWGAVKPQSWYWYK